MIDTQVEIIKSQVRDIQEGLLLLFDKAHSAKQRRVLENAQRALTKWYDVHTKKLGKIFI